MASAPAHAAALAEGHLWVGRGAGAAMLRVGACLAWLLPSASEATMCPFDKGFGTSAQLEVVAGDLGRQGGIASSGPYGALSLLRSPRGVVVDPVAGRVYIADSGNHVVRSIGLQALSFASPVKAETVAGTLGRPGSEGDFGLAQEARLRDPHGLVLDVAARKLYIADAGNHAVRLVDLVSGSIVTVAGVVGSPGSAGDRGRSMKAQLNFPTGLALDTQLQRLYVADSQNHAIRVVDLTKGVIATIAGELGVAGSSDNGPSMAAKLNTPFGIALDSRGFLYVTDSGNHAVRRFELAEGEITRQSADAANCRCTLAVRTVAGTVGHMALPAMPSIGGRPSARGGAGRTSRDRGPALAARLRNPSGLALDEDADVLYIADASRPVVLRLHLASGNLTTAVSRPGYWDQRSEHAGAVGLALDLEGGALYLAEALGHVVRRLEVGVNASTQSNDECLPDERTFRSTAAKPLA